MTGGIYNFTCLTRIQLTGSYDVINTVSLHLGCPGHRELSVVLESEAGLPMPGKCYSTDPYSHTWESSSLGSSTLEDCHLQKQVVVHLGDVYKIPDVGI